MCCGDDAGHKLQVPFKHSNKHKCWLIFGFITISRFVVALSSFKLLIEDMFKNLKKRGGEGLTIEK